MLTGRARNVVIADSDWLEEADTDLSASTGWQTGALNIENIRDDVLTRVARSTGQSAVIEIEMANPYPVSLIMIPRHNLPQTARWRIQAATASSFALETIQYDSRPTLGTTTSATSLTIGTGAKTLYVVDNTRFLNGARVRVAAASDPTGTYMEGDATTWDSSKNELVLNVDTDVGSGTYDDWIVTRLAVDINVWPEIAPFGEGGSWGEFQWGNRLLLGVNYSPPAVHYLPLARDNPDPVYAKYWRITIDRGQTGYVDIGRLLLANAWQPSLNISYDWTMEFIDPSPRSRSRGGQFYVDARPRYRRLTCNLQYLPRNEMFGRAYEIDRTRGVARPIAVIVFPDDPVNLHRMSIYGSQPETTPISNPHFELFDKALIVEEWI